MNQLAISGADVRAKALRQAMIYLRAAGAQFAVIDHAGVVHGDLRLAEPEPERKRRKRVHDHVGKHDYINRIMSSGAGDVTLFPCDDADEASSLSGSVSSLKCRRDIDIVQELKTTDGFSVEVLMVENREALAGV